MKVSFYESGGASPSINFEDIETIEQAQLALQIRDVLLPKTTISAGARDVPPVSLAQAIDEAKASTPKPPVPATAPKAATVVAVPTEADVKAAITAYANTHGLAAASELVQRYGVERVSQITPEQRAAVIAEAAV